MNAMMIDLVVPVAGLTATEQMAERMVEQADGEVAGWRFQSALEWLERSQFALENGKVQATRDWLAYLDEEIDGEDVPGSAQELLDYEGMTWCVVQRVEGTVTRGRWEEAWNWLRTCVDGELVVSQMLEDGDPEELIAEWRDRYQRMNHN